MIDVTSLCSDGNYVERLRVAFAVAVVRNAQLKRFMRQNIFVRTPGESPDFSPGYFVILSLFSVDSAKFCYVDVALCVRCIPLIFQKRSQRKNISCDVFNVRPIHCVRLHSGPSASRTNTQNQGFVSYLMPSRTSHVNSNASALIVTEFLRRTSIHAEAISCARKNECAKDPGTIAMWSPIGSRRTRAYPAGNISRMMGNIGVVAPECRSK